LVLADGFQIPVLRQAVSGKQTATRQNLKSHAII